MARPLHLDELVDHFTLDGDELKLLRNKSGATRLGFGLLLKFLIWRGRFPRGCGDLPDNAIDYVARQVGVPPEELAERLLLAVYGYGTNTGLRAVAAGDHGHSEDELRYVRRRFLTPEAARAMAVEIANATFAVRQQAIWGARARPRSPAILPMWPRSTRACLVR